MDKKVVLSLLTLAVCICALQVAEPVAAGTLFDSGKWIHKTPGTTMTTYYKSYYGSGKIYFKTNTYATGTNIQASRFYLKKINSNTIKKYEKQWTKGGQCWSYTDTYSYTGSATSYYWNKFKPEMKKAWT